MNASREAGGEQEKLWNGLAAQAWVEAEALLDRTFKPIEELLVAEVCANSPGRVLDVGCGTGVTTVGVARRLGTQARCTGIDISETMLAAARARAERAGVHVDFIRASAQDHAFHSASFDSIMSRFGVMFFEDFTAAFANLRRAAADRGELRCITWRSMTDNPFMTTAERVAAPLLPDLPPRKPDGPGQFALADEPRVREILERSGWMSVELRPLDIPCTMPENALVSYLTRFGPVGRALMQMDAPSRDRIVEAVRPAFDSYVDGADVRFTAACWMIAARGRA
ncbi:MAG TPA: class I SAM-dependent methyltransferase [Vicinamibacterales bacterium]|jgi:SAM-dependent methyltransferase